MSGLSSVVRPTMARSSTDQYPGRPSQPASVRPSNSLRKPGSGTKTSGLRPAIRASTISRASSGTSTFAAPTSAIFVVAVRSSLTSLPMIWREPPRARVNSARTPPSTRNVTEPRGSWIGGDGESRRPRGPPRRRRNMAGPSASSSSPATSGLRVAVTASPSRRNAVAFPMRSAARAAGSLKSVTTLASNAAGGPNAWGVARSGADACSVVIQFPSIRHRGLAAPGHELQRARAGGHRDAREAALLGLAGGDAAAPPNGPMASAFTVVVQR